jgi:cell shape-determining protein MreD
MTRTTLIIFGCCVVLSVCVSQLNHYLAPLHLSLFAGGLLVTFAALRLDFRAGWWSSLLIGLLIDSSTAVAFGFHGLFFVAAHVGIFNLRGRFPREETIFALVVALLANLALFIVITASLIHRSPSPFDMLPRLASDLLASELLVLLVAPWFFALQEHTLELGGVSLRREQRGLL